MKQSFCIALSSTHLLALAISTYIAAIEIESIIVTGWICSLTGIAMGAAAVVCGRPWLAVAGCSTFTLAVTLFILEAFFLHLGPQRAALPFCIVFIINQVLATLVILTQLRLMTAAPGARAGQVTIKTLLVAMVSFSVFFGVARHFVKTPHDWMMAFALGLLGLTFVGLSLAMYALIANQRSASVGA